MKGGAERGGEGKNIKIDHKVLKTGLGNRRRCIKEQEHSVKGGATIKGLGREGEN